MLALAPAAHPTSSACLPTHLNPAASSLIQVTFYEDCGPEQLEVGPGRSIAGHRADILGMDLQQDGPTPALVTVG